MQLVMEELQIPVPTYRFESKKIMVGTTTESLMEKEQKIKSSSGPQKKRVSEQQPDSRGRRRVTLFVCGEYGYPCPLIESIEIKNVHQLTSLKLIVKPLVHEAGQSLVFSGLSQGDLLFVDVPVCFNPTLDCAFCFVLTFWKLFSATQDVGEQGAKRLKTSQESYVQTVLPSTESLLSSIELEIRFKPYCNSLPTRVSIDLDPAEGVKEHMFHVTFTPPTSEEQQPSFAPPTLIQSCSKTLDELWLKRGHVDHWIYLYTQGFCTNNGLKKYSERVPAQNIRPCSVVAITAVVWEHEFGDFGFHLLSRQ